MNKERMERQAGNINKPQYMTDDADLGGPSWFGPLWGEYFTLNQ